MDEAPWYPQSHRRFQNMWLSGPGQIHRFQAEELLQSLVAAPPCTAGILRCRLLSPGYRQYWHSELGGLDT